MLLDADEIPDGGALQFTWARVPYTYRRGAQNHLRIETAAGWQDCPTLSFNPQGVRAVEATLNLRPA